MHAIDISGSQSPDELGMFRLDDEDIVTDLDATPWESSFVGELPRDRENETLVDVVRARHQTLSVALFDIESTCEAFDVLDSSAHAAEMSLRRRVGSLSLLVDALGNVSAFVLSEEHRELFAPSAILGPYLDSVHLWLADIAQTLGTLAHDLNTLTPDWSAFRAHVSDVSWIFDKAMSEQARVASVSDTLPEDLRCATQELAAAFVIFKSKLDEPFG